MKEVVKINDKQRRNLDVYFKKLTYGESVAQIYNVPDGRDAYFNKLTYGKSVAQI
jgi:hypothetical protein